MVDLQVPFGKTTTDGRIVTVEEVQRGSGCACICPECNNPLLAAKGVIYRHHFRHVSEIDCRGGVETALHKLAKQVICDHPDELRVSGYDLGKLRSAVLEQRLPNGLIPDVLCEFDETIAVEIWVAHQVGTDKIRTYNDEKIAALEIDLRSYRNAGHNNADWNEIVLRSAPRKWLSLPQPIREAQRIARETWLQQQRDRIEEQMRLQQEALERAEHAREERQRRFEEERAEHARQQAIREAEKLRIAELRAQDAEYRQAIAQRLLTQKRGPDLQQLVIAHGGYDRITPEAWKVWDHDLKTWQDRMATGWFRDEERRLLGL